METPAPYVYHATLVRTVDGDTVDVLLTLGFEIEHTVRLRLLGIDAPEKRGTTITQGKAAQAYLAELCESCKPLIIRTTRDTTDKYGRYLAEIFGSKGENLNLMMIAAGHAIVSDG